MEKWQVKERVGIEETGRKDHKYNKKQKKRDAENADEDIRQKERER
jgi:hypothetical protein